MKPYAVKQGGQADKLISFMVEGVEYTGEELAPVVGGTARTVNGALHEPKMRGFITVSVRGNRGRTMAHYVLLKRPEIAGNFNPQKEIIQRVIKWRGGSAKPGEKWPVGPCVDFSNRYVFDEFYA
jgi:hypothetical protein